MLGKIIERSIKLRSKLSASRRTAIEAQIKSLYKLLDAAMHTQFGKHYAFENILASEDLMTAYSEAVDIYDYQKMQDRWWNQLQKGIEDVSWPGKVKYFALSSGTTESASKHIPVTKELLKSTQKVATQQIFALQNYDLPSKYYLSDILMLGGSTALENHGEYMEGDMSGISAANMPKWMSTLIYRPGQKISSFPTWEERIDGIVKSAPKWNVGTIAGIPSWVKIVMEKIIEYHEVENIHQIWPNLELYMHGGVSIEPYRKSISKLLGRPIQYMETYMASEGSFGFQKSPDQRLSLSANSGIYFEFVPFNSENFDDGKLIEHPVVYNLAEVTTDEDYALLISTPAGAWRYLVGDVIRFSDVETLEFKITGRTRQFLSICGEHTSVDNFDQAIEQVQQELGIEIGEYVVLGDSAKGHFWHHWYVGCDDEVTEEELAESIDKVLCKINDDYRVERKYLLDIKVEILPNSLFLEYLKMNGKYDAMRKIPRVLKGDAINEWLDFVNKAKKTNFEFLK